MKLCLVPKTKKTHYAESFYYWLMMVLSLCKYFNAADEDARVNFVNCKCFCHRGDTFLWLGCLISTNTPPGYQLLRASADPETKVNTRPVINTTGPSLSDTDDCQWLFLFTVIQTSAVVQESLEVQTASLLTETLKYSQKYFSTQEWSQSSKEPDVEMWNKNQANLNIPNF